MDLNNLSLSKLKTLKKNVDIAIADFEARKKREALAEIEKKAADLGFSLSELLGGTKAKKVSPPKYRNPANPDQTWTGKGRAPKWIVELDAKGISRDTALI